MAEAGERGNRPAATPAAPWRISLHGGHSRAYCDHAHSTLVEMLDAAVRAGYRTFGVTEHAPRTEARFLYPEEVALGWDVQALLDNFDRYAAEVRRRAAEYAGQLEVLCAFETEAVPAGRYLDTMAGYRDRYRFDYTVGSVHHVDDVLIDSSSADFAKAAGAAGGVEALAVRYYGEVAVMTEALRPEVVSHFDLIAKNAPDEGAVGTPPVRHAARHALAAVAEAGSILDLNTAGYRKGLGRPYPAPWVVEMARDMGIPFCFGDDSHDVDHVGADLDRARQYLMEHGVTSVTGLTRNDAGGVERVEVPIA